MNAHSLSLGHCARCDAPLEPGDLRCAVCALAVPAGSGASATTVVTQVRCEGCGAVVSYDVHAKEPKCAFCGAVTHVERIEDPIEQADAALPFAVSPEVARTALKRWLASLGFFRPSDLASSATVHSLQPLWWPAWVFEADGEVTWTADSNAGSLKADWAPHAGHAAMRFDGILVPASRGLTGKECVALGSAFRLDTATREASAPAGVVTEQFDVQRSSARQRVIAACESHARKRLEAGAIPGSRFRNVHLNLVLRGLRTRRLSMPTYVLAYRYREKLFRVLVHGQDAGRVVGDAPISWAKVVAVAAGVLAALALIVHLAS